MLIVITMLTTAGMTVVLPVLPFVVLRYVANPGDLAVWVGAAAAHREEAFAACRELIDAIKLRVPIWKRETYTDGHGEWIEGCRCASSH